MAHVIPLKLFQTWHTKDLPTDMKKAVDLVQSANPEFQHFLFDDADCRSFIEEHFDKPVVEAFDTLIPGAFKSDLWRYCVLYIQGGIYLDIKYIPVNGFKFITMTDKEYFVKERNKINCLYTGLMVCKPRNEILFKAIQQIVENVTQRFYGKNSLDITGPTMLVHFFSQEEKDNMECIFTIDKHIVPIYKKIFQIKKDDEIILEDYETYRKEQKEFQKEYQYDILYKMKRVYKKSI
jgi:mannosyltransferase OCH1-like enzyme